MRAVIRADGSAAGRASAGCRTGREAARLSVGAYAAHSAAIVRSLACQRMCRTSRTVPVGMVTVIPGVAPVTVSPVGVIAVPWIIPMRMPGSAPWVVPRVIPAAPPWVIPGRVPAEAESPVEAVVECGIESPIVKARIIPDNCPDVFRIGAEQ